MTSIIRSIPLLICQIFLWTIVAAKLIWVVMGLFFSGATQPLWLFALSALILALATVCFGTARRPLGLALSLAGVAIAFVAGQMSGYVPGPNTSRYEEQYRNHIADYLFLCAAILNFILTRRASIASAATPAPADSAL